MSQPDEAGDGGLGKSRIEAFSDGVFAIAITLLVLDIKVPTPNDTPLPRLLPRLLSLWPELFSYALSFVIIGVYWVAHHLMLHALKRADRTLLWINNLFLMCVALIPFSAGVLGQYRHAQVSVVLYGLNLIAAGLSLELLWLYATRTRGLSDSPIDPRLVRAGSVRTLGAVCLNFAAIGLSFLSADVSLAVYWLAPLLYVLMQSRDDRRVRNVKAAPAARTPPG